MSEESQKPGVVLENDDFLHPESRGEVLRPSDARWQQARHVNNERLQGCPAVIARCAGVADVRAALALADAEDLQVSVRSGGHSVAGWSTNDGGLVIDLTPMRWIHVNSTESTAWVGGGTRAIDLILEAAEFGLVPVTGVSPAVGITGLVLALGEGYLTPKHGFGCDSILACELVTANGDVLRVSADEHPDLFWAIRGAGANFGVVTALELRLHPAPAETIGGWMTFSPDDALRVTRHMWKAMAEGSEYFCPFTLYELDELGALRVKVLPGHTGPAELAKRETDDLLACATPTSDDTRAMPYLELLNEFGDPRDFGGPPHQRPGLAKRMGWNLYRFDFEGPLERQIEVVLDEARHLTPLSHLTLWRTVPSVAPGPASVAPRFPGVNLFLGAFWHDAVDDEEGLAWLDETSAILEASGLVAEPANAVNHVYNIDERRLRRLYGDSDYTRLARLKAQVDPGNRFSRNANIPPAA